MTGRFAYRERAHTPKTPVVPVELLKEGPPRSQKVKVRWLEGEYEGLDEWVPKVRLIARWEEIDALLRDENLTLAAVDAAEPRDTVEYEAVRVVLRSLPIDFEAGQEIYLGYKALERELLVIEDLDVVTDRLRLSADELLSRPHTFVDRFGRYKGPFDVAREVATHICRSFSGDVLTHVRADEQALEDAVVSGFYIFPHDSRGDDLRISREMAETWLAKERPIFDLIRRWCGEVRVEEFQQTSVLRQEVDRLQTLVEETARFLRFHGHPVKAALVLKELRRESVGDDT